MKVFAHVVIALTLLWAGQAFADSDTSNKDHQRNESSAGGNGTKDGSGNSQNNRGKNGFPESSPSTVTNPAVITPSSDQNAAADAVASGSALPLSDIVERARTQWGGKAIDAKLFKVHTHLVYQLTMLSEQGVSRRVYYDAASGRSVKAP